MRRIGAALALGCWWLTVARAQEAEPRRPPESVPELEFLEYLGAWAEGLLDVERVVLGGIAICVVHDIADYRPAAGDRVVVTGHSHAPRVRDEGGVLYLNPGSAGPRRFRLPISIAELRIDERGVVPRLVEMSA